jgi:carbon-monoxide dehydrogenase medium subunit
MIRDFHYLRPASVQEALELFGAYKDDCKIICGGQSLLILMRQGLVATEYLLDIKRLEELNFVRYHHEDGLTVGAVTSHRTVEKSALIGQTYPVLSAMERNLASIQVRNWGTLGGNLAHADAAGDPAPVLMSLGARVKVGNSSGTREIPLNEFYVDLFETALADDEIILEIKVPPPAPRTASVYEKFNLLQSDQGVVAVAATITLDADATCKDARIALGNSGPVTMRSKRAEQCLIGNRLSESLLEDAGAAAAEEAEPITDIHASEEFRRHLVRVLTGRMVRNAWDKAASVDM